MAPNCVAGSAQTDNLLEARPQPGAIGIYGLKPSYVFGVVCGRFSFAHGQQILASYFGAGQNFGEPFLVSIDRKALQHQTSGADVGLGALN